VDGVPVAAGGDLVYLALNKPVGVVSTAKDPQRRQTVLDLVPAHPRVFPVGRLDRDSGGLLLLTNDGEFSLRVSHPRYGVPKIYVAEVEGAAGPRHMKNLLRGIELDDGPARAEQAKVVGEGRGRSLIEIEIREGRNRLVRRMLDAVGLPVLSLTRTQIGPVRLARLKPGDHRALTRQEIMGLQGSGAAAEEPD
jgi:23S rRNA pseudouridine2605 synthase